MYKSHFSVHLKQDFLFLWRTNIYSDRDYKYVYMIVIVITIFITVSKDEEVL